LVIHKISIVGCVVSIELQGIDIALKV